MTTDPFLLVVYALAVVGVLSIVWFVAHHGATVVANAWHAAQVAGSATTGAASSIGSVIAADVVAIKNDVLTTKNKLAADIAAIKADVAALKAKVGIA